MEVQHIIAARSGFERWTLRCTKCGLLLQFVLANEKETIRQYRRRVRQADELNEFAIAESLRGVLMEEQDHLIALATALGVDPSDAGIAD
jgi:bacterioferritin